MNYPKLIEAWSVFRKDFNSIQTICDIPPQMKDDYDRIDSTIYWVNTNNVKNPDIGEEFYLSWERLYKIILDPSHFFEIDQIISVLKQKKKILKAHTDIKIEDVESFSLFIMALEGLQNSWKKYLQLNRIPQPLSQYNILIGEMYSFFNTIFTEPQHKETSKDLTGIEKVLFSLQSLMTNFQIYEKMIDSANLVHLELTLSRK